MNRTVLITGASSGMGKEAAKELLRRGHTVYAAARRVDKMQDLVALGATALEMDITREEDVVRVVETIATQRGGIDVLVNNAGFGLYGAMEDTTLEDARYQFDVNLFGLARLTQLALPHMRTQRSGTIVNISSMGGKIYTPLGAWYHASKHALEGWSDCLRLELAPFGIHVAIVEPGAIQTDFGDVMSGPMLERSGSGPYAPMAQKMAKATAKSFADGAATPAAIVGRTIADAATAAQPRTRYVVGKFARPLLFARRWLSDRLFDRLVLAAT